MDTTLTLAMIRSLFVLLVLVAAVAGRKIVDLTHTFDKDAPKYPLGGFGDINPFNYFGENTIFEDYTESGTWLAFRTYEFYEHQGTHIDAPIHYAKGRQTVDEIPPERLIGPGVVIDVRDQAKQNPNYAVTVQDILDYEDEFGRIPPGAMVMMNSGWAAKYPNSNQVFGTQNLSDPSSFNFPGYSLDACKMLLNKRQVSVVGVDTPSTDPASEPKYYCHKYLQPNQVPLLEYVANLDAIPQNDTTIVLGAIKMRGGTGGPTRIFALIDDEEKVTCGVSNLKIALITFVASLVAIVAQ